jgi:predicted GIY-YIG superfamily endonuclease
MSLNHHVYVLSSQTKYYVGMTSKPVLERFAEHVSGSNKSTRCLGSLKHLKIIHYWTLPNYRLASKVERFIHRLQNKSDHSCVLDLIKEFPEFSQQHLAIIDSELLTTHVEKTKTTKNSC